LRDNSNQGTLFRPDELVQRGTWRPPESLPVIQGRFTRIGFDQETNGNDKNTSVPCGTSIATPDGKKYYLPKRHLGGGNLDPALVERWAKRELRDITLVGLNIGFDAGCSLNENIDLEAQGCHLHDVAHAAALLNEHRYGGFNLDDIGKEYTGQGKSPCPVEAKDLHKVHSSLAGPYAEDDAMLALRVDEAQQPLLEAEGLGAVMRLEDDLIWANNHMERNGARLDRRKLVQWDREIKQMFGDTVLEIHRQTGMKINPNSPQDLTRIFKHLNLENSLTTASGDQSFTKEILESYDHPIVKKILDARQCSSLRSKYLDKYLKQLGQGDILRYHLYQLRAGEEDYGTVSGRYSSANVNIQQVFKAEKQEEMFGGHYIIRELFIPDDDMDFFAGDASQIEFRLFGHYSGSKKIIGAYREDPWTDFHDVVAKIMGQKRSEAKHNNFGKIYGMGRRKTCRRLGLACTCGCPDDEFWNNDRHQVGCPAIRGNEIIDKYDAEFPEARRLMKATMDLAGRRGWVKTVYGRRARFPDGQRLHAALNRVIQGGAADLFKLKLLRLYRERKTLGIHKLRMPVHDEATGDLLRGGNYRNLLVECFQEQELELKVPILWDIAFGNNWKECA
jgi:DNA polymerase I-like protein with 3'-5' exonuclease and polymerase domains